MTRRKDRTRATLGFTMAEMMAAVSILAVMMAIAIPNLMAIQRSLRMMQLDAEAQVVYNAVQSRLSALSSTGQADILAGSLSSKPGSKVVAMPADYPDKSASWEDYGLFQLSSSDEETTAYLVTSEANPITSALLSGSFVVEVSPATGEVYSVYYWEGDAKCPSGGDVDYSSISGLRSREERSPYLIGYYGGSKLTKRARTAEEEQRELFSDLDLSLVNSEELYASVKTKGLGKVAGDSQRLASLRIDVTVEGESCRNWGAKEVWSRSYSPVSADPSTRIALSNGDGELDFILDSMRDGLRFSDIVKDVMPGSDITVTVSLFCDVGQDDPSQPIRTQEFQTNSLYESRDTSNSEAPKVSVSTLRHLRNLDLRAACASANIDNLDAFTYGFARYTDAEVTGDIDFDGTTWEQHPECVSIQSRNESSGNGFNPLASFSPISASKEIEATPSNVINGNGHVLKNFRISSDSNETGLFGDLFCTVDSLNFEDPVVSGKGDVGTLVGVHRTGSVRDCHVFETADGKGQVSGTGDCVGGLVGRIEGWNNIENCSSAVNVLGAGYVGGLVGDNPNSVSLENCNVGYYKNDFGRSWHVTVTGTGDCVGGIAGRNGSSLDGNRSLADVSGANYVGGLCGYLGDNGSINGSMVGEKDASRVVSVVGTGNCVGGLAGSNSQGINGCASMANVSGASHVGGVTGEVRSYSAISNTTVGNTASNTAVTVAGQGDNVGGLAGSTPGEGTGDVVLASVSGASNVGGLVGDLSSGSFSNSRVACRSGISYDGREVVRGSGYNVGGAFGRQAGSANGVTSAVDVVGGADNVGGLSGWSSGAINACSVHQDPGSGGTIEYTRVTSSGNSVGGLVGYRDSQNISGSFAAVYVRDGDNNGNCFGGLVGYHNDGGIDNCYATGDVGGWSFVGGLAGYRKGGYWNQNIAAVNTSGADYVGGIAGYDELQNDWGIQNCTVLGMSQGWNHVGALAGGVASGHAYQPGANVHYVWNSGYNDHNNSWELSCRLSYDQMAAQTQPRLSVADTHPYSSSLVGRAFPFGGVWANGSLLPYYGDWPIVG